MPRPSHSFRFYQPHNIGGIYYKKIRTETEGISSGETCFRKMRDTFRSWGGGSVIRELYMKLEKFNSGGKTNSGFPAETGVVLDKVSVTGTELRYMISGVLSRITLRQQLSENLLPYTKSSLQGRGAIFVRIACS